MSKYNEILSNVGRIGQTATQAGNTIASFVGGSSPSASTIRDTYLNGFFGETNLYSPNIFSRLFDEPTYLTFRIEFNFDKTFENQMNFQMSGMFGTLDNLPEPLLTIEEKTGAERKYYSTWNYLKHALGEGQRANMLNLFIEGLKDIQEHYPYYFQSVAGLGNILKVVPADGIRLKDGENIISIKCLEGLDMKITQLMQLYKNVAWDDYYQRWILPDMMRFFNVKIYVSEIRLFHSSKVSASKTSGGIIFPFGQAGSSDKVMNANSIDKLYNSSILSSINDVLNTGSAVSSRLFGTNSSVTQTINSINHTVDTVNSLASGVTGDLYHLCNSAINDVMPTICFDCHMCEFDIEDTATHLNELTASTKETSSPTPEIKIKIGKMFVKQIYPLNVALEADGNKYKLDSKKPNIAGSYIDDSILMQANYYNDKTVDDIAKQNDIDNAINKEALISNVRTRMINTELEDTDFSYRPSKMDQGIAALALATGITNEAIGVSVKSTATQDESLKKDIKGNNTISPRGNFSTATLPTKISKELENILSRYSAEETQQALSTLSSLRDSIYDNKELRSAATTDNEVFQLKENVMSNVLDNISKSEATSETRALKDLVDIILNDTRSTATSRNKTAFSQLN